MDQQIVTILCKPDREDGRAQHIGMNPRYVVLIEENEDGNALIVFERRTLVAFDGRAKVVDILNGYPV